ncbi:MAG: UDP-N-acetylglucosamine--N-acetylmuramyl-(pentapeptide) pyrophosphoryl-undecaprenol N-acetylglucosamine transferase [Lentisphaerae bacterium]|nr:UDP-N-acetylglucosamine--N-acetylmuramyl-(pentapeptide) pyrophosphoryl-undecaprenol N-acetylglucosamine transferase [Lentisphaerota bacterium]
MKIAIACGGTGGHIFPGLAVARVLQQRDHEVALYLAGKPGEDLAVADWTGPVVTVPARGMSSRNAGRLLVAGVYLLRAIWQSRRALRRSAPDALLAMGSYASAGPVLAARWLRIPIVLHEANVIPGRAISFLSRRADAVAVSFSDTSKHLAHRRLVVTGMPVRWTEEQMTNDSLPCEALAKQGRQTPDDRRQTVDHGGQAFDAPPQLEIGNLGSLAPNVFTLLVMGGSRGAHRLNEIVSQAIMRLHREGRKLQVIHLTGLADEQAVRQAYQRSGVPHAVFGFLRDMPRAYRLSFLAICRSGASTCAELSLHGVPALLVPYPYAIHRHQTANADALAADGAADLCDESLLSVDWLYNYIVALMHDEARLARMRAAALGRAAPNAAAALADLVEQAGRREEERSKRPTLNA